MKKRLFSTACASVMLVAAAGVASAAPETGTFAVEVWQGTNPVFPLFRSSTDPSEQALPSAITAMHQTYNSIFNYTGGLDFAPPTNNSTLSSFFASDGGTTSIVLPNNQLSSGNFADVTLMKFTFTLPAAITGTVSDDDGVSLFAAGTTTTDLFPTSWSAPTSAVTHNFALAAGTYDLYYAEVNGPPASLDFDVTSVARVPEPATLSLLGAGMAGVGLLRRRRTARAT